MLCENCGKQPASVHMTRIENNQKTELHLCQECARNYHDFPGQIDFQNLFASLFDQPTIWQSFGPDLPVHRGHCPSCGFSLTDIRQSGKIGCSECYHTFHQEISPLLRRIHGSAHHVGKVPPGGDQKIRLQREIESLRAQLTQAVQREDYEKAAELRDAIRDLEKQLQQEKEGGDR